MYAEADYANGEEAELRLLRLDEETGRFVPAGTTDRGDTAPTDVLGEYGIDTEAKTVWTHVNKLGTFALTPFPEDDRVLIITRGTGMCGILGIVSLVGLLLGMGALRLARHNAPTAPRNDARVSRRKKQGVTQMNKGLRHTVLILVMAILLAANSGCTLVGSHFHFGTVVPAVLLSFVLGQNSNYETRECFLNGNPIACTDAFD